MTKEKVIPQIRFSGFTDTWEQRKLGDTVQITMGQSPDGSTYSDVPSDYILVQGNADLQNGWVSPRVWTSQMTKKADAGDLIMSVRAPAGAMGKTAYNAVIGRGVAAIKGNEFIYQLLEKMDSDGYWKALSCGSTFESLNSDNIKNADVLIPDVAEQEKIGEYFLAIDRLITLHQRKYDKLTKVKKAMLEKMFPENGSPYPEIRFKGFTDAWEQRKFSELTEIRSASRVHKEEWQSSGVPFYRSSDVMAALNGTENEKAFISEELYEKLSAVSGKLEKGDILVTGGGSVGKPYIVPNNEPLYTKDADLLWVKNNEKLVPYFIYTFFFSPAFSDYLNSVSHVGTIAHYTITQLEETPITLPCVSEQQKIGDYFRNIDSLITLHQRKLEKLKNIKKACLEKMFV